MNGRRVARGRARGLARAAKPNPLGLPGLKRILGGVVVTTDFLVPTLRYDTLDTTGAVDGAGS